MLLPDRWHPRGRLPSPGPSSQVLAGRWPECLCGLGCLHLRHAVWARHPSSLQRTTTPPSASPRRGRSCRQATATVASDSGRPGRHERHRGVHQILIEALKTQDDAEAIAFMLDTLPDVSLGWPSGDLRQRRQAARPHRPLLSDRTWAHRLRQPVGARYRRRACLVRGPPALDAALHAQARLVAEPDRMHVLDPPPPCAGARFLHLAAASPGEDLHVHALVQRDQPALRVALPTEVPVAGTCQNFWRVELEDAGVVGRVELFNRGARSTACAHQ